VSSLNGRAAERNVKGVCEAYSSYIAGLHIVLDYLTDLEEDDAGADLNFVAMYPDGVQLERSLGRFEVKALGLSSIARHLLRLGGSGQPFMLNACLALRGANLIRERALALSFTHKMRWSNLRCSIVVGQARAND